MKTVLSAVLLLLCEVIEECESRIITDSPDVMNRTDRYGELADFRCYASALKDDFDFAYFPTIGYVIKTDKLNKKLGCTGFAKQDYPIITGTDPMMPYYINNLHRGIPLARKSDAFMGRMTPLQRTKEYCATIHLTAAAFLEYWEKFHSESVLCEKMVDIIKICHEFLQMREMFAGKMYEKLCLSEDGCYNVMAYYENDLPYCVKNTAITLFKNSSVGSWHHTIINYCKLTEMVPGVNEVKYDTKILTQKGRTREKLREMCLYLRYRLLPEEGKEQEIPDDVYDDDISDTLMTTEANQNGIYILVNTAFWNVVYLTVAWFIQP